MSEQDRDPSTTPRRERLAKLAVRQYKDEQLTLSARGLHSGGKVKLHIEHKTGAALIVPECDQENGKNGPELSTRGFDGTEFKFTFDEWAEQVRIEASAPSAILGGETELVLPRVADIAPASSPLRITGDEDTMPIGVKK